ncbi:MAG: amidohydrolase family protein [Candidatus Velthaea sp.]
MIDVHTHLHPPRLFAAIRRWFADNSDWKLEHASDPHAVAAALRGAGVSRFVFCSYAHKPGMAQELNAWLAATSRQLDGYGLPLATVHLDDPSYARDARRAFEAGCIGLKIHENVQRLAVDDRRFDAVFESVVEAEGFVLAHIGAIPWIQDTNDGPGRVSEVLERHPRLRMVVAHMGVPDTLAYIALTARYPNLFLDTTMAFTSKDLRTVATAADLERAGRCIVYGSDYPNIPYAYADDRRSLEALGLSDAALAGIFGANARRLSPALGGP